MLAFDNFFSKLNLDKFFIFIFNLFFYLDTIIKIKNKENNKLNYFN